MKDRYGVIFFDNTEVIFRIYEVDGKEWKLLHYHSALLQSISATKTIDATETMEVVAEFLTTQYAQHIAEWKACSRDLPPRVISELSTVLGFKIENLNPLREQELLCKGMFTELW